MLMRTDIVAYYARMTGQVVTPEQFRELCRRHSSKSNRYAADVVQTDDSYDLAADREINDFMAVRRSRPG